MANNIKNYLGISLIITVLMLGWSTKQYVAFYGQAIQPSSFRSFTVSADDKVVAVPDIAEFTFGVLTEGGKDIAALQKQNTEKMNKAIAFVKSKGVSSQDIKTQSYLVSPRYQSYPCERQMAITCKPDEIIGYEIRQSVDVKIRDFGVVGDVLSGVVQNGANNVSQILFTIDDRTKLEDTARAGAIRKAQERAQSIADAGGFKLGRLLSLDENSYQPLYNRDYMMGLSGSPKAENAPSPSIEPGSENILVSVSLKYEIR